MPTTVRTEVDPATLIDWMNDPDAVTVLDVRSPAEFETRQIAGSYNLPLDLVGEHAAQPAARLDRKVVLVWQSGVRPSQAQQRLGRTGIDNLHGRPRWTLERQVRLVAGGLVVPGVVASRWAPRAVGLAGAVGTGLTISALTDTCTMGRVLSALPYNRGTHPDAQRLLNQLPTAHRS